MTEYLIQDIQNLNKLDLKKELDENSLISVSFPLESIGFANSRLDIIYDYILVSYCCEELTPYINIKSEGELYIRDTYYTYFKISFEPQNIEKLLELLNFQSLIFSDENEQLDDISRIEFNDNLSEYEQNLHKKIFFFPELINNYWANLINGAYWEIASEYHDSEEEFFKKTYKKYPEHKYGYWKNPNTKGYDGEIYFSTENWIISRSFDLIKALKLYSGLDTDLMLEDAERIEWNNSIVLLSSSTAVRFNNENQLKHSILCAENVLVKRYGNTTNLVKEFSKDETTQLSIFSEVPHKKYQRRKRYVKINHIDDSLLGFKVSEFGDLIVAVYKEFYHVFFTRDTLKFEEIKELNESLFPVYSKIQDLIGLSVRETCDWSLLDDDKFEELCYDILYYHPYFDSNTIQKMGKSKSRDGGRDITIKSKRTPTSEPQLYLFQCKYYSSDTSLSASKVPNAGNVILQYGAKGYGVFTTSVIDATLYDMLDGFERSIKIDTSIRWSKYELERFLNRNQHIKRKYFNLIK